MPNLPLIQTSIADLSQLETKWKAILDPLLRLPILQGRTLSTVKLTAGSNQINHGLGRKLVGWLPVRWHGAWAQIYDNQDLGTTNTGLFLVLVASAPVTVDLYVY